MLITVLLALVCLVFDLLTPLGTSEWGVYLIPMLLTGRVRQPRYPLWFAAVCSVLSLMGLWLSPPGVEFRWALLSRGVGVVVFWVTAFLLMQRQTAEQALQNQKNRLQAILDNAPMAIFVKDRLGRYQEFNRQCETSAQMHREQAVGKDDREVFPPELAGHFQSSDEIVFKTLQPVQTHSKFWREDEEHTYLDIKFPLFDGQGRCTGLCGISTDITRLKQVEEELLEKQAVIAYYNRRLRLLAQATGVVVGKSGLREEGAKLAEQMMAAFDMDACVIRSLEGDKLVLVASAGVPDGALPTVASARLRLADEIMTKRQPMFVPDLRTRIEQSYIDEWPEVGLIVPYAAAPLLVNDEVLGLLSVYSRRPIDGFSKADLEHLQIAANHIAVAIANDRMFKETQVQKDRLAEQVAERRRTEAALNEAKERLQSLSRRLLELQETERRHIARELHDEIGQALTALKINLQAARRFPEPNTLEPRLLDSINIVDRTLRQVRNLSLDLRPSMLDDFGLCAALRWYADQQAQRAGLQVQFVAPALEGRLEPTLETACFRVAQEALTNIVRHAQAQHVLVRLEEEPGFLHLTVRDDGIGFDLDSVHRQRANGASFGLLGMKERAFLAGGRVELRSRPGEGTEVHGWFPRTQPVSESSPAPEVVLK